jgi:hypothetical protein
LHAVVAQRADQLPRMGQRHGLRLQGWCLWDGDL